MNKKQQSSHAPESTIYDASVIENYTDRDGNEKSRWSRIGVAFPNADGKGFNVELVAYPVNGKLTLRLREPRPDSAE